MRNDGIELESDHLLGCASVTSKPIATPDCLRFGDDFELDLRAYELRSGGIPLKLKPIPMELLLFLVAHRGELITREQIVERIWGKGVFLDTDNSINGAISKIRQVLRDDVEQPRFVQTVTGKGYRFIAAVVEVMPAPVPTAEWHTLAADSLAGKRVSHYRILQVLGGGGMGVVYKAEDLKLGRRVAIKFLPAEMAGDTAAFERLQREARAASALDHPNICAIHELGEHEGQPFIVMQLLEGQTLREWIETAAPPGTAARFKELLDLGIQIADWLDAAHQKGIIHRDVKPANIFVTTRGEAKVLDFGVAKLLEAPEVTPGLSGSVPKTDAVSNPTLTRTGASMGTPSYLSPEQIRGEKLDARTDLFSLGTVLYEMATGECPFAEGSIAVTLAAVLNKRPAPVTQANPELPGELEKIIEKALEKDRNVRYSSAANLRNDLQSLKQMLASGQPVMTGSAAGARVRAIDAVGKSWKSLFLAALAVLLLGLGLYRFTKREGPLPFQNFTITQITDTGKASAAAVSPDGKYILNVQDANGAQSIWLRNVATGSDTEIIPPSFERYQDLAFSPDGNYVYFLKIVSPAVRNLYRLPVLGGIPQLVARDVDTKPSFSPDGQRIAYVRGNDPEIGKFDLLSATLDGGDESVIDIERIEKTGNNAFPRRANWSDDGKKIAYTYGTFAPEPGLIRAFDLARKHETTLARFPKNVLFEWEWLSKDQLLGL